MPRVTQHMRQGRGKGFNCAKCGKPIVKGEGYYMWGIKAQVGGTTYRQHVGCGMVKQSQLTHSKMSGAYAAIEACEEAIARAEEPGDLASALNDCATEIESVKDEYQESLDNMPEPLQQGPTGEEITEKVEALEEFYNVLTDKANDLDGEEFEDDQDDEEGREDRETDWFEDLRNQATDTLGEFSL